MYMPSGIILVVVKFAGEFHLKHLPICLTLVHDGRSYDFLGVSDVIVKDIGKIYQFIATTKNKNA